MESSVFESTITFGHSVVVPEAVARSFAEAGHDRVQVIASFAGRSILFHAALQKDKLGQFRITFGNRLQKELGVFPNDYFELRLKEDTSKYGVDMPEEMEAVLMSDPEALEHFESFTPGKKRSLIYAIKRYKNSQTKIDKCLALTENLKRGISDPKLLLKKN